MLKTFGQNFIYHFFTKFAIRLIVLISKYKSPISVIQRI